MFDNSDNSELFDENYLKYSEENLCDFLINHKFYLTALEFYAENLEKGITIPKLKTFFTNPENFGFNKKMEGTMNEQPTKLRNSPSISTIDSIDFSKQSDDGNQIQEDKIKILEFELRKQENEVQKLRHELTQAVSNNTDTATSPHHPLKSSIQNQSIIMAHETRVVNFLINQYLLQRGLKLTAISFAEEVPDQDVECWDDVGLNMTQLPDLIDILRGYMKPTAGDGRVGGNTNTNALHQQEVELFKKFNVDIVVKEEREEEEEETESESNYDKSNKCDAECQVMLTYEISANCIDDVNMEMENLKSANQLLATKIMDLEKQKLNLVNQIHNNKKNVNKQSEIIVNTTTNHEENGTKIDDEITVSNTLEGRQPPEGDENLIVETGRLVSEQFKATLDYRLLPAIIGSNIAVSLNELIILLGNLLPQLSKGLDLKLANAVLPLLLSTVCLHNNSTIRDDLIKLLFHSYSKPTAEERLCVLSYLRLLAAELGAERVESEILPQILIEISASQGRSTAAKRQLIAEACGVIAPFVSISIRDSLLLSVLQQLLESEHDSHVLCSAVRSLSQIVCRMSDQERLHSILKLLKACIHAGEKIELLNQTTRSYLLPAIAEWCLKLNVLHSTLLDGFLADVDSLFALPNAGQFDAGIQRCIESLCVIEDLIPYIMAWIVSTVPSSSIPPPLATSIVDIPSELTLTSPKHVLPYSGQSNPLFHLSAILGSTQIYREKMTCFISYCGSGQLLISASAAPWPAIQWLSSELLPKIFYLLKSISPTTTMSGSRDKRTGSQFEWDSGIAPMSLVSLCSAACSLLRCLGSQLGTPLTDQLLIASLKRDLFTINKRNLHEYNSDYLPTGLLAAYLALLAMSNQEAHRIELKKSITNLVFLLSTSSSSLFGVRLGIYNIRYCAATNSRSVLSNNIRNSCYVEDILPCNGDVILLELVMNSLEPALSCTSDESVRVCGARLLLTVIHRLCTEILAVAGHASSSSSSSQIPVSSPTLTNNGNIIQSSTNDEQLATLSQLLRVLESVWARMDCLWREGSGRDSHDEPMPCWACASCMLHAVVMMMAKLTSLEWKLKVYTSVQHVMNSILFSLPQDSNNQTELSTKWTRWPPKQFDCLLDLIQFLLTMGPSAPENFRDQDALPWLQQIVLHNNNNEDTMQSTILLKSIVSTLSGLSYYIADEVIASSVVPMLTTMRQQVNNIHPDNYPLLRDIDNFLTDLTKRTATIINNQRQKSMSFDSTNSGGGDGSGAGGGAAGGGGGGSGGSSSSSSIIGRIRGNKTSGGTFSNLFGLNNSTATK